MLEVNGEEDGGNHFFFFFFPCLSCLSGARQNTARPGQGPRLRVFMRLRLDAKLCGRELGPQVLVRREQRGEVLWRLGMVASKATVIVVVDSTSGSFEVHTKAVVASRRSVEAVGEATGGCLCLEATAPNWAPAWRRTGTLFARSRLGCAG